jgi:ATP-dependent Lhr-like helicase
LVIELFFSGKMDFSAKYSDCFSENQFENQQSFIHKHALFSLISFFLTLMSMSEDILEKFHPLVRSWFSAAFGEPSPPQQLGWPSISQGKNTLIVAPTGSGKTLAAFLWCINHLVTENIGRPPLKKEEKHSRSGGFTRGIRVLYISPLKALNNDIHRNLEIPLNGILNEAEAQRVEMGGIRSAVRTGDTTQTERARMLKNPPDILITTPESLYLMLSSEKARTLFHSVQYVIVDEIHSISNTKRGVHLSLSLERLEHLIKNSEKDNDGTEKSFVRIGLSATQRPLDLIARFLGGMEWKEQQLIPRFVNIVDAGYKKSVDLKVICAARDFSEMPMDSIWSLVFPQLLQLIHEHRTTLIFVNNRRLAERVAARLNEMLEGLEDTTNNYAVPFFSNKRHPSYSRKILPENADLSSAKHQNKFPEDSAGNDVVPIKVFAYHGSMSRTVREQLESDLKQGKLRVLITTSALELGIDIGTVDLVVQIQSPKGIARGLQRIGRSGHLVNANSKGRLFVTHREDLVECTVVAKGMTEHAIENTFIPHNCLDVLAQQIVAMVGIEEWNVEEIFDLIRQSYCYHSLSEKVLHSVLDMLAGRYTNDAFRELRARIMWNKLHNQLAPLPGSSLLAIMNAGTIPDRGYFGVYLEDMKTKVGEVDEEFIYESRPGDTFILGSNVWRMMDIDANKVVVSPAPGQPARMPFWRGEGIGRTYELGVRVGEFLERLSRQGQHVQTDPNTADPVTRSDQDRILSEFPIDSNSVRNIIDYVEEQRTSTHIVPTHTSLVVEGFRDEVGDPRIVIHSCYGKGVNGLLGIVLTSVLRQRLNIDIQMLYNNDGILFRCSDAERLPLDLFSGVTLQMAQQIILEEIPSSPLFGALFRQNAERALLLPKGSPGKRRPFFLQRLKSADLLQVVRQYSDFPIVIETIRECLTDVLDFEHFKEIITKIETEEIRIHTVQNETPSPFASTLLFDFAAVYMYGSDDPKEKAKQQFALLNRELVAEVVNLEALHTVVRADAVIKVEEQLQFTASSRRARTPEELMEVFLRLGELTEGELSGRVQQNIFIEHLRSRNIILPVSIGNTTFFIAAEEIPIYRPFSNISNDILALLPKHFQSSQFERDEALRYVIMRMLRSHGTLTTNDIASRFALTMEECDAILRSLSASENIVHGILTKESEHEQWCYRPNLERIHRASISILRKEIKPATLSDFTQLLLRWQHRHPETRETLDTGLHNVLEKFQGFTLSPELWESEIFSSRIQHYEGKILRQAAQRGEYFCVGTEAGRTQWIFRGDGNFFLEPKESGMTELTKQSTEIYDYIKENGASFLSDIRENTSFSLSAINRAIAELFWMGFITNDVVDEALNVKRYRSTESELPAERIEIVNPRRNPLRSVAMKSVRTALKQVPGWNGRWSLVHTKSVLGTAVTDEERIRRQAQQLLLRYGVVAREIAKREENLLPWSLLAMEFQRMEMRGEIRRGYFVEGLSGMQFALPDAVNMLDGIKSAPVKNELPVVLNACDPANPYGTGIELPSNGTFAQTEEPAAVPRLSRLTGNYIVFDKGTPIVWIENVGARIYFLVPLKSSSEAAPVVQGLSQFISHIRDAYSDRNEIVVEYCNNLRPSESGAAELLRSLGFYRDKMQTLRLDLR